MNKELLKELPNVNELSKKLEKDYEATPRYIFITAIRKHIDKTRKNIISGLITEIDKEDIINDIKNELSTGSQYNLKRVINATGTIIHTNLGRSIISKKAVQNIIDISTNYNNLEYNLGNKERGSRYEHLEKNICKLTGAEAAVIVNNNAGAVLLTLVALTHGGEAVVSRGELIEIGGSFRIPEIMNFSGTKLVEVGATNRVHAKDYIDAITKETKSILKVHTSNFKIQGFTKELNCKEIADIAKKHKILAIEDLGSGNFINLSKYGKLDEPVVSESIQAGMDIVTFSGDKILGGAQCGIIVGKKELVDKIKAHNLIRTLRVSKITLAALEVTINQYLDEKGAVKNIPTLKMMTETTNQIEARADNLLAFIKNDKLEMEKISTKAIIGGGSMPTETLDSFGLSIKHKTLSQNKLLDIMHNIPVPIIPVTSKGNLIIDLKTIFEDDFGIISDFLNNI